MPVALSVCLLVIVLLCLIEVARGIRVPMSVTTVAEIVDTVKSQKGQSL